MSYNPEEQRVLMSVFHRMLAEVTKDGGNKREKGEKAPWFVDPSHEVHFFHHLYKWKNGERVDEDSQQHPLVHAAWRLLAIAYQETYGTKSPVPRLVAPAVGKMQ